MSAIKSWQRVPDGSQLTLSVGPYSGDFVSAAWIVDDQGNEEEWSHPQLSPGPQVVTFGSPQRFVIRVHVAFAGDRSEATIEATIVTPDGRTFGTPYTYTVEGQNGTIQRATIVVSTLQS